MAVARSRELADWRVAMIAKHELLDMAAKLSLNPHVVEKDYALGWMSIPEQNWPPPRFDIGQLLGGGALSRVLRK